MFCTNCGKKLYDGDKFCAHCGTKVRTEEPKVRQTQPQEIVFNPPFKVEAERRTSEIFRGFASEEVKKEAPRKTEPANFDWNLDGFPGAAPKKTEEVNFNWDSVVERRNERRSEGRGIPVVDKIDIHSAPAETAAPQAEVKRPEREPLFVELPEEPKAEEIPVLILPDRNTAEVKTEPAASEEISPAPEEIPLQADVLQQKEPETDSVDTFISVEDLEKELFGEDYRGVEAMSDDDRAKSTAQLEKFYTYNQKQEAFQELLDKEYERLKSMEEERKPDAASLEYTWAGTLFPAQTVKEEPKEAAKAEPATEVPQAEYAAEVPATTIDFTPIRQENRLKNKAEKEAEPESVPAIKPEPEKEPVNEPVKEPVKEPAAELVLEPAAEAAESAEEKSEPASAAGDTAPEAEPAPEAPVPEKSEEAAGEAGTPSSEEPEEGGPEPEEKLKLRYSDIFPREAVADGAAAGGAAAAGASKVNQAFAEEDEDDWEPKRMNPFVKFIIFLLIVLILLEGAVLISKLVAPESAFAVKADEIVEMIMDKLTGGDGESGDGEGGLSAAVGGSGAEPEETYITDFLAEIEVPDSIGQILEDSSLTYDMNDEYAFGDAILLSDTFTDETWKEDEDGDAATYAQGILKTIVSYYGQWKATNKDTSLIGINKLEIGEIRTGEEGHYVLCRLTFAGADGDDVVKHVTAYVKTSQDSMVINEIKEEQL